MKDKRNTSSVDVVGLVDSLLREAAAVGASDVHFEPTSKELVVKYRLDGVLTIVERVPKLVAENVVARLKVIGGLLTYRNDIPQEGAIQLEGELGGVLEQRLAVYPTIHGQRAVVRMFYDERELTELGALGFSESIYDSLSEICRMRGGMFLVTGPAGSGKSTTLGAMLRRILEEGPGKSIVALEDPVERHIDGITQVQVSQDGEMNFPRALRSLLRQDPEVLMIGEIRDAETATIAVEAGLTGHLMLSTMHSGTPAGALLRLLEMGIEPYQVTSSLVAVLNQRLVRRLCLACRRAVEGGYEAGGCGVCLETGYKGRAVAAELVMLDGALRQGVLVKMDADGLDEILRQRGHMTIGQDARRLVRLGRTSEEESEKL